MRLLKNLILYKIYISKIYILCLYNTQKHQKCPKKSTFGTNLRFIK